MIVGIILCTIVCGLFVYVFYKWATRNQYYFVRHKIKHLKPDFLIGNTLGLYLNRYPFHIFLHEIYNSYPNEKLIGFFDFQKPTYMVCDAELMNQIGVTKFDHFNDLGTVIGIELGVLYGRSLAFLSGNEWRAMRSTLTPAFTRHKLRHMFEYMNDAARKLVQNLIKKSQEGSGRIHCKIAQLFACYAADITASCFFGLKIDSFENPTNEFIKNAKDGLDFSGIQSGLRVLLLALFPKLMHAIDFDIVPKRVKTYFKSIVLDVMDQRTERQIFRPDMINTLMKIRNKRLKCQNQTKVSDGDHHWTDDELVAQLFISCISSFDAISNIPAFMAYELALNQNVQQKLYDEIQIVNKSLGKQPFTFDALLKLKFLDQVIDETLRKYPAAPFIIRKCTKDVELVLGDSKTVKIERGMNLWIPISSIQCDPENFENPNKFDPERFNEENKRKIRTGSYIPFWIGPRNCIGYKFALMAIKILFFNLLLNFTIEPYEATQIPLEFANTVLFYKLKKGIHLKLKSRVENNLNSY